MAVNGGLLVPMVAMLAVLSNPSPSVLLAVFAFGAGVVAALVWLALAGFWLTRARPIRQRRALWFLVAPAAALATVALAATGAPLEARWALARGEFDDAVALAPPWSDGPAPTATDRGPHDPISFDVPDRLGSYRVSRGSTVPAGVFFHTGGGGIGFSDGGFAHLPDGPPGGLGPLPPSPDLGIAWFETITFRPLGHGWYAWSAVQ